MRLLGTLVEWNRKKGKGLLEADDERRFLLVGSQIRDWPDVQIAVGDRLEFELGRTRVFGTTYPHALNASKSL